MLDQVYGAVRYTGERISNVVVMGIGEPLDNLENLLRFIEMLTDEKGLHISQRSITVSTCGLEPKIRELADENLQITLALSLHGVMDEKRRELMPIAEKYSIAELMDACRYYFDKTGRRITFEYALADGVNDTEEDAKGLIRLASSLHAHKPDPRQSCQGEKIQCFGQRGCQGISEEIGRGWNQCNTAPGDGTGYRWRLWAA